MDRQTIMHDLTLMLMAASSWEDEFSGLSQRRAWKGYDFDVLDLLEDEGYAGASRRSKSVALSDAGMRRAEELFEQYGIALDPEPEEQRFFRFFLSFNFSELSCTRTLLVPEHTTFEDFHTMIQACLNWMNYHLYDFTLVSGGEPLYISWPDYETGDDPRIDYLMNGEDAPRWVNAATAYLDDFFPKTREAAYSYDYGDGWEIRIRLANRGERIASANPICWEGLGDAPPEDVGGEGGFVRFLQAVENPDDEDHDMMLRWGEGQGFERFKPSLANKRLSHWQDWARADTHAMPSEAQMRAFGRILAQPGHAEETTHLKEFKRSLDNAGLSPRTVRAHVKNVGFFIDEYLTQRRLSPEEGLDEVEHYLGDWLVNEDEYTSKTFLRDSAASLNKFYQYLASNGRVSHVRQREVQQSVRAHLSGWVAALEAHDQERLLSFMRERAPWQ